MSLIFRLLRQQSKRYPALYALLALLTAGVVALWISDPLYSSFAINKMLQAKQGLPVNYLALIGGWLSIFAMLAVVQTAQKFVSWKLDSLMVLRRREEVYEHVLALGISFHTKQKSGEVVKILDEGADMMSDLQRNILIDLIPSFITALVFLVIGFVISPILAGILLLSLVLYMTIAIVGTKNTALLQYQVNKLWVESIGRAYDTVTNIYSVKSGSQERREMRTLWNKDEETYGAQQKVNRRWAVVEAINFFMLTRILLISIGMYLYTRNIITLGEVYFFQSSFFRVLTPFEVLGGLLPQWNKKVGKVRLAQQILETPIDVHNTSTPTILENLHGEIRLENACFSYQSEPVLMPGQEAADDITNIQPSVRESEEEKPETPPPDLADSPEVTPAELIIIPDEQDHHGGEVLHTINLTIWPGEHIAFVGHSGAGKTTLAMLLNRFYDVTEGQILIDGIDLRELDLHWWRSQIGLVLQENIMFNDSILENIRYARPEATMEEVKEAARRAAADEFIEVLPNGYHTLIGDRGIRLSGGQRQRVAIARAILKKPTIVVLDEATSALDSVTEKHVQEGIHSLIEGRTSCIIAHRLSTVRSVDRIAVFHEGKLIDVAPHEELVKRCSIYREMVELQSQGMLAES